MRLMAIEEKKTSINANNNIIQNIVLENREKLSISGVLDVLSFDDQIVILETELGLLTIKGENLRINKLSLDTTEVVINGEIYNLGYTENNSDKKSSGLLNKIFK
jgi:sporulation protein yabP